MNPTTPTHPTTPVSARPGVWTVALALSALALAACLGWQLARNAGPRPVSLPPGAALAMAAGVVSSSNEFTLLTADGGSEDILFILDGRGESLLAYRVANQSRLDLVRRWDLKQLFTEGRNMGAARPK